MVRGKKKENLGSCKICGCENALETYRKLNTNTLAKAYKSSDAHLLPTTIKTDDQLCQQHYNQFVLYMRNKIKPNNKCKDNKDSEYHESGWPQKRICLSQNTYEQLINNKTIVEQLQQQIIQLKSELNDYEIASNQIQINGIYILYFASKLIY